jgi:hypothetical protein
MYIKMELALSDVRAIGLVGHHSSVEWLGNTGIDPGRVTGVVSIRLNKVATRTAKISIHVYKSVEAAKVLLRVLALSTGPQESGPPHNFRLGNASAFFRCLSRLLRHRYIFSKRRRRVTRLDLIAKVVQGQGDFTS